MDIVPDGPAASSKLAAGDVITAVDGRRVATVQGLKDEIRPKKVGAPLRLSVQRNGKEVLIEVDRQSAEAHGDESDQKRRSRAVHDI
ncbi:MAG: PDZ domain-containing protein [Ilumatobacteraceae bacterium]